MFKIIRRTFEKKEWIMTFIAVVMIVIQVYFETAIPRKIKNITALVQGGNSTVNDVLTEGVVMTLFAIGAIISAFIVLYMLARVGAVVATRLRYSTYEKSLRFSLKEVSEYGVPSLITRCSDDVTQIQQYTTDSIQNLVKSPVTGLSVTVCMFAGHRYWLYATLLAILAIIIIMAVILGFSIPVQKKIYKVKDNLMRVNREHITGIRVSSAYNGAGFQKERFEEVNARMVNYKMFTTRFMNAFDPSATAVVYGLSIAVYVLGAVIINGAAPGDKIELFAGMVSYISYSSLLLGAIVNLILVIRMYPDAAVSAKRVNEILDCPVSINDGEGVKLPEEKGVILEFEHVSFKYPEGSDYVLKDVSFEAKGGETVAIIGATGCGKTSLLNLIPRLYDSTEGTIRIDGKDVRDFKLKELRNIIGYVPQKSYLFSGTISANIAYGDNGKLAATINEIEKAARVGQAEEFIKQKEGGYEAPVLQGGNNFSGGQRQRLTISRAICRNPRLYIFDDSFSALDFKTDSVLRKTLRKTAGDATMLIVAQRIATVRNADKILVMDNGTLVGQGTHEELLNTCDVYKEIVRSQVKEEEMGA